MNALFGWALQVLILTLGIYVFLRFVRSTRGSRLVRGLVVAVIVGVLGLWGLAKWLELEELNYIFQSVAGYVVVILAILFQPELRRGIAQLGEHKLIGRLRLRLQEDAIEEVAKAVSAMAARKHGALIAFERETPLSVYIEGGVTIDSVVTRLGIESLFHPGSALHDGAVIVRKDRIASASCLFPLTKNPDFSRLRGTRHRAALGLTEETDAVTVTASEETGSISICRNGEMRERVPPGQLKELLRSALGAGELGESADVGSVFGRASVAALRQDLVWIAASLVIGAGVLYIAHRDMSITETFTVRIVQGSIEGEHEPLPGELAVLLPTHLRLAAASRGRPVDVEVSGTRGQLDDVGPSLSGVIRFDDGEPGQKLLALDSVHWTHDAIGVGYGWVDGSPQLETESYATATFPLGPQAVELDATDLDPRYQTRPEEITFDPDEVVVSGPSNALDLLSQGELELRLEPLRLTRRDVSDKIASLSIHPSLARHDLAFQGGQTVAVKLPILPATRDLGVVTKEIAVVCMQPDLSDELGRWTLPPHGQSARFTILTSGLLPATTDPGSPGAKERNAAILRFVEENLVVFVDTAELPPPGQGHTVPVRWTWRKEWKKSLDSFGLDMGSLSGREFLDVRIESERQALLEERAE